MDQIINEFAMSIGGMVAAGVVGLIVQGIRYFNIQIEQSRVQAFHRALETGVAAMVSVGATNAQAVTQSAIRHALEGSPTASKIVAGLLGVECTEKALSDDQRVKNIVSAKILQFKGKA